MHDDGVTVGHSTFDTSGLVTRLSKSPRVVRRGHHNVMNLATRTPSIGKTVADLDALHGINTHHCLRQHSVQLPIPLDVASKSNRDTLRYYLKYTADRGSVCLRGVYGSPERFRCFGVVCTYVALFHHVPVDLGRWHV